jgi:hypothetical protein
MKISRLYYILSDITVKNNNYYDFLIRRVSQTLDKKSQTNYKLDWMEYSRQVKFEDTRREK